MKQKITAFIIFLETLLFAGAIPQLGFGQGNAIRQFLRSQNPGQEFVHTLNQDKEGFFWMGTNEGLFRFDGSVFIRRDTNDGLAENYISSVSMDSEGVLWIGHNEGGVSKCTNGKCEILLKSGVIPGTITAIMPSPHGNTWLTTKSGMLISFEINKEPEFHEKGLEGTYIFNALYLSTGKILIGTSEGLKIFDPTKNETKPVDNSPLSPVTAIALSSGFNLAWVAFQDDGLFHLKQDFHLEHEIKMEVKVPALLEINSKELWIGTYGEGFIQAKVNSKSGIWETQKDGAASKLNINCLLRDKEEQLWMGSAGDGLVQGAWEPLVKWEMDPYLVGEKIDAITILPTGIVWIGTEKGIFRFPETGVLIPDLTLQVPGKKITALISDVKGTLWVGTEDEGLFYFTEGITKPKNLNFGAEFPLAKHVNSLMIDPAGMVWAGTLEGLFRVEPETGKIRSFTIAEGLPHNQVRQIACDPFGKIWLVTQGQNITSIEGDKLENISLQGYYPSGIAISQNGSVWIGTSGQGILEYKEKIIQTITQENGLPSNTIYQIYAGEKDFLWTAHRTGFAQISTQTQKVKVFNKDHELSMASKPDNKVAGDKSGKVVFLTGDGPAIINPAWQPATIFPPTVRLKGWQILGNDTTIIRDIELPFKDYSVKFFLSGSNTSSEGNLQYRYKLEGTGVDWSEFKDGDEIFFPVLGPGKYNLRVEARNSEGIISDSQFSYSFSILQPFYKRTWFIVLALFVLLFGVYAYIHFRTIALQIAKENLEKIVDERTEEIRYNKEEIKRINTQLEIALRGTRARNDALVNAIPDLMLVVNRQGILTDFRGPNLGTEQNVLQSLRGQPLTNLVETQKQELTTLIKKVFESRTVESYEFQLNIDGKKRVFEARAAQSGDDEALLLARDITDRIKMEEERSDQQKEISKAILETQENERKRFAEDLHDGLGQLLSASKMNLNTLQTKLKDAGQEIVGGISNLKRLLDESIQEARGISHNLMPGMLKDYGLKAALEDLTEKVNQAEGTQIRLSIYGDPLLTEKQLEISLYRVVQEVVNNALKHSKAKTISIQMHYGEDKIFLNVEDDGLGFNVEEKRAQKKGIGLFSLENRIRTFDGFIEIDSSPGKGTLVSVEVPVKRKELVVS